MKTARALAILVVGTAIGVLFWFSSTESDPPPLARETGAREPAAPAPAPAVELSELPQARAPAGQRALPEADPAEEPPAADDVPVFTFVGELVLPNREPVRVAHVRAALTGAGGLERTFEGRDVGAITVAGVPKGRYQLMFEAAGHRRGIQELDLTRSQLDGRGPDVLAERVTLWPQRWIPVVVRTRDGRPFRALAEEQGLAPKRLFVHAFRVGAGHEPFEPGDPPPPDETELAVFHPPPGYQNVELPGSVACSIELRAEPPFWIGLWIHGVYFASRLLHPGDAEVLFEIDMAALDERLATLTLRVVDRDDGTPVVGARGTLKADTSAHRRADLGDVATDDGGRLTFRRVIPGRHELAVLRGENAVQRRLVLAPGQDLDLGDVAIGSGPGLRVKVVDVNGAPVPSWIEVAPLEPGRYVESVYPPNLHRQTDDEGVYVLPVPDRPSIVRARPFLLNGRYREYAEVGTRNALVDPGRLPPELVLVAGDPVSLRVEPRAPWVGGHRLTFEDELGMIVDVAGGERDGKLSAELAPGPYVVRRWDGEREAGRLDVRVELGQSSVECP